jgi:hypothetical protein
MTKAAAPVSWGCLRCEIHGLRPRINRLPTEMMARTRSTWMKPPIVWDETKPKSQATIRMTAMVSSR